MSHRVTLLQTAESFAVDTGESVLEAALRQDVKLAHECTFGACGTCRVKLVAGQVAYDEFPIALTREEAEQGYALACQARPTSDLVISAEVAPDDGPRPERRKAMVKDLRRMTPDICHLSLELPDVASLDFRPGQYMNVFLDAETHRSFSMASVPNGSTVDFHVRRIAGGRFTGQRLNHLRVGDTLDVELPLGNFRCHTEAYRPLIMAATGTGLAPIKSMLESLMDDADCPPVWLYWGMRSESDLYLDEDIRTWGSRLYEFQYTPVLSRAASDWQGRRGHVQEAVLHDLPDLSEHAIYLCGSPSMIHDAKHAFLAHGADIEHIHSDGFSFQHRVE